MSGCNQAGGRRQEAEGRRQEAGGKKEGCKVEGNDIALRT